MLPLIILSVFLGSEIVLVSGAVAVEPLYGGIAGGIHALILFTSIYVLTMAFRRRQKTTSYKRGFNAFGAVILLAVPGIAALLPGLIFLITGNLIIWEVALIIWGMFTLAIIYGIVRGRWAWKVHNVELKFENLPAEMDGTTVVQISDIHIGSFFNLYDKVKPAVDKINALKADYLVFTGDLVNNIVSEVNGWEPLLQSMLAKKGKFSILGNHDYGDYVSWENEGQKSKNLDELIEKHREIGFTPLLNSAVELHPEFYLLGVENWGVAPFRQSGKLKETLADVPDAAFKLLLSHDPSHFDEQVVGTSVDLTLSGHTHGMQFGIERFGLKWSPVSLRYKKWAGLYNVGKQFLYVNRGFGYLGFPGRVGIYPEITHIVLRKG